MTLDLKAAAVLSRVRLLNWDWDYRVQRYKIESSLDGAVWTNLVDASAGDRIGWEDWPLGGASARYLRFTGLYNSKGSPVLVAEWEVYGTLTPQPNAEVARSNVNVREAGEGRLFVRLASRPLANVAVGVSRASGDAGITVRGGASLTFTPSNWNVWQAATLAAAADGNDVNETAAIQVSVSGGSVQSVTATALDDDIGTNLALAAGGATISGISAVNPALVLDGIHTNRSGYAYTFSASVPPGTMTLDLKSVVALARVRLLNWDWDNRFQRYRLESSLDGTVWTNLVDASAGNHVGWEDLAVSGSARYLKFTGLTNSVGSPVLVSEWEVYGTPGGGRRSLASVASGAQESEPVSVLTSAGPEDQSGWNAVDGDSTTAWVGQKAGGGYLVIEYRPALKLSALEVELAEGSLAGMDALFSQEGLEWQPLPEDMETNPVSLNFLWLLFPDDGSEAMPDVFEIIPNP